MELEAQQRCGAGVHERSAERVNQRNGYRERKLDTRIGAMQLRIPKLRQGSYFPSFLEPRKASEQALVLMNAIGARVVDGRATSTVNYDDPTRRSPERANSKHRFRRDR